MDADVTRTLVDAVERDLVSVSASHGERPKSLELAALEASWRRLVQHLALGPAPEVRGCPVCGGTIMRAAIRCLHCWAESAPPAQGLADQDEP